MRTRNSREKERAVVDLERKILILHELQAVRGYNNDDNRDVFPRRAIYGEPRALSAAYLNTPFDGIRVQSERALFWECVPRMRNEFIILRRVAGRPGAQTPLSLPFFDIAKRKCLLMIVKCACGAMPAQDRSCAVSLILIQEALKESVLHKNGSKFFSHSFIT
jgi:hypothetical protein